MQYSFFVVYNYAVNHREAPPFVHELPRSMRDLFVGAAVNYMSAHALDGVIDLGYKGYTWHV